MRSCRLRDTTQPIWLAQFLRDFLYSFAHHIDANCDDMLMIDRTNSGRQ